VLLDAAIEHADRWAHGSTDGWDQARFQAAKAAVEQAIALMQSATTALIETAPQGMWGGFDGEPEPAYLGKAVSFSIRAEQILRRLIEADPGMRETLRPIAEQVHEAWDILAGVAVD
jgi:hypothetical protein